MASNFENIMAFIKTTLDNVSGVDISFRHDKTIKSRKDVVAQFATASKGSWWLIVREAASIAPLDCEGTVLWTHNVMLQGVHRYKDAVAHASTSEAEFETIIEAVLFAFADPHVFDTVANTGYAEPPQLTTNEKRILSPDSRVVHFAEIRLTPRECIATS